MKLPTGFEIHEFDDGEIIVREGDESREMFIIRTGSVEVLKHVAGHEVTLTILERGSFFGEMSLLEGLPRSATVRARGNASLAVLRPGSLLVQLRRDPTFAFELLQQMSRRVRELNDQLVFKVATAEFGNRLARSSFMLSAAGEYGAVGPEKKSGEDGHGG
ncbi:MAG: cyclic nucleotide-binding domain-containing protein [Gemmatimonadota bacterium]